MADKAFKEVIELNKKGEQVEALKICTDLVKQFPYDVQFRHRLAMLQKELGKDIDLPTISAKNE